jgi:hypothetical protein
MTNSADGLVIGAALADLRARRAVDRSRAEHARAGQLPPGNVGVAFLFGVEPTDRALAGWMPIFREQDDPGTEKSIRNWLAY